MNGLVEVRAVRDGHGLDVGLIELLPDVRPEDRHEARWHLGDVVDLDLEEGRIDVVPARLERVELRSSEAAAVQEGLAVLEEVVRPADRVSRRRGDLGLRCHDELGRERLSVLGGHDPDLAGSDLRRGLLGHVEQERVDPIRPGADDRDLRALEPAVIEERLAVLELVALDLVPEEPALRQRTTVDGLDRRDLRFADLDHLGPAHAPDDGHPPVEAWHQRRRLRPDLAVSGDDLSRGHLPPAEPLHEDSDLAGPDQIEAFQEKRQRHDEPEPGHKYDRLGDAKDVCHLLPSLI